MSAVYTAVRKKLTVEGFHALVDAGVLGEDDRIELIEGEMIEMAPIGGKHMGVVNRLNRLLVDAVGDRGVVSVQNPIALPPHSEPQPDFTVLTPGSDTIERDIPRADAVLLLVEVSDTTLGYDRQTKLPLYARHGIPEVWIVDGAARRIEIHRQPTGDGYAERGVASARVIEPIALPGVRIGIGRLFD